MKCAIYVRVSTDEQAKAGYSLAAQVDQIKSFIKNQGWTALAQVRHLGAKNKYFWPFL